MRGGMSGRGEETCALSSCSIICALSKTPLVRSSSRGLTWLLLRASHQQSKKIVFVFFLFLFNTAKYLAYQRCFWQYRILVSLSKYNTCVLSQESETTQIQYFWVFKFWDNTNKHLIPSRLASVAPLVWMLLSRTPSGQRGTCTSSTARKPFQLMWYMYLFYWKGFLLINEVRLPHWPEGNPSGQPGREGPFF
jgi:hypothetical protein